MNEIMRRSIGFSLGILLGVLCFGAPQSAGPTMTIQATDQATGEPIFGASVIVETNAGRQQSQTDDYGQCALTIPAGHLNYLSISVEKSGYVCMAATWENVQPGQKMPGQLSFAMEMGTTIGGKVVDEAGKPVAGAVVHLLSPGASEARDGKVRIDFRADARTDAAGRWSVDTAPPHIQGVEYTVTARGFYTDAVYRFAPPIQQLRNRSAVLTINHAVRLEGIVLGPAGKPVAGAKVTTSEEGSGRDRQTRTDAAGKFTLEGASPGEATFSVLADHFAPQLLTVMTPSTQPTVVHLRSGTPMKLHVVNRAGKPLVGVHIDVERWRDTSLLNYRMHTDADGNAIWPDAPADEVLMIFSKPGRGKIVGQPITATTGPINITLGPKTEVHGAVVDAATGKPFKNFTVLFGSGWIGQSYMFWHTSDYGSQFALRPGHESKFTYSPSQSYPQYALRIEADGYTPATSRRFADDEGDLQLKFEMVKGTPVAGTVYTPDRKPVAGAKVFLIGDSHGELLMENNAQVSPQAQPDSVKTNTQGQFSFPSQIDSFGLVCIEKAGYANLEVPDPHPSESPILVFSHIFFSMPAKRPTSYDLKLQPWATVQGRLMIGSSPGAELQVGLRQSMQIPPPYVFFNYTTKTDSAGRFRFDRVPPGEVLAYRLIRKENPTSDSDTTPIIARSGQNTSVQIGGTGRPIIGKFALPPTLTGGHWIAPFADISTQVKMPKAPDVPADIRNGSFDAQRKWLIAWENTPEGKAYAEARRKELLSFHDYLLDVRPDGSFRADDVPAGTYDLEASFYPPNDTNRDWNHPLGTADTVVIVPPMAGGRSDEALDVGTVPVEAP
jgi:hypothetical protein